MLLSFKYETRLTAGFCDFRRRDVFRKTMGSIISGFPTPVRLERFLHRSFPQDQRKDGSELGELEEFGVFSGLQSMVNPQYSVLTLRNCVSCIAGGDFVRVSPML